MLTIIATYQELTETKEAWNALYAADMHATFFQTYIYVVKSWEHHFQSDARNRLHVILVYDGENHLQAILPMYIDGKGWLRFINDADSDFCDMIVDAAAVRSSVKLMTECVEHIRECKEICGLRLVNLRPDSWLLNILKILEPACFVYSSSEHTYLQCRQNADPIDGLRQLDGHARHRLRVIMKKQSDKSFEVLSRENSAFPQEMLEQMRQQMIDSGMRSPKWFPAASLALVRDMYEAGMLEIPVVKDGETPLVAGLNYVDNSRHRLMLWIILYRHADDNLLNNLLYFEYKVREGDVVYDFGRGGYDYKIVNFKPEVSNLYTLLCPRTFAAKLKVFGKVVEYLWKKLKK